MTQPVISELEKIFTQFERHLIGLFAIVALEPTYLRAFPEKTTELIDVHLRSIEPLQAWAVDPDIIELVETDESLFTVLALIQSTWATNPSITLGYANDSLFVEHA